MYLQHLLDSYFIYSLDLEKKLSKQFEEVLKLIQEDAFWNNVGEGIEKTYPEIKKLLKERMKDLENVTVKL